MAHEKRDAKRPVESYEHRDKQRVNNPPVGLVTPDTDPDGLDFDPTCGSGTTAHVAEQWGRRWITCDTSRVAFTLAKQRLMTAVLDYYKLAHPEEGVGSGFKYKTVPHVTLKSIANNPDIRESMTRAQIDAAIARHTPQETLYDQPFVGRKRTRVSGPFTVEAVPAPAVKRLEQFVVSSFQSPENSKLQTENSADSSIARTGETRPSEEGADRIGETVPAYSPMRVVVSFGPEHAPLEQRQVAQTIEEAQTLVPRPKLIVFVSFQFDPKAARDVDKTNWPGVTLLKAQMNADLLTEDLKKTRASNELFWLIGQPDVEVRSFEFLVFSADGQRIAEYGTFKKLSGLDRLTEIHRLGWQDLFFYALLSQGRDVWTYLTNQEGWDFHSGQYLGRTGQKQQRRIPPVSWSSARLVGGIGDFAGVLAEFEVSDLDGCRRIIERLRRDREIVGGLEKLSRGLNFPIQPSTKNWKLETKNLHRCAVHGFDYYKTKAGDVESGNVDRIAVWLLDSDYDGRSLYPRQIFFPMAGDREGWARQARNPKAEINEERIAAYRGTLSLPFEPGEHRPSPSRSWTTAASRA